MTPEKMIDDIIRFYNIKTKTRHKVTCEPNRRIVKRVLDKTNGDFNVVCNYIEDNYHKYSNLIECLKHFTTSSDDDEVIKTIEPVNSFESKSSALEKAMEILANSVAETVAKTQQKEIEDRIFNGIEKHINDFIKNEYGSIQRKVELNIDNRTIELNEVLHEKFDQVLKFVASKEPVFLTGKAGTGKNVICKQVAKALGLDFYFSNAVTQEYKITGFTDANGIYHETQFYKAFKNGGLFMLDEMDASIPEVLIILNSAIANGYFDFPAPIGYVEANENFRVVGAGNTFGLGADYEYVGRNQLDMASLDRFAVVKIDYDENIEKNVSNNDNELLEFVRDFRDASEKAGIRTLCSYRGIGRIEKMLKLLDIKTVLQTCLIKNLGIDELNNIMLRLNKRETNKFYTAFKEICLNNVTSR